MTTSQEVIKDFDLELWNYLWDLEKQWKEFMRSMPRLTDKKLLEIFPEAKQIIPSKIKEWEEKRDEFSDTIKKKLTLIKYKITDEFSLWFWREWVKVNEGQELLKIDGHIMRLKHLLTVAKGRITKERLTEEQIQQVLAVSIETLINQPLRKSGKALVGLCPFHNEKHPSFFVYPTTNSFYCYGCQKGGNTINFVEELYNFSFTEAVEFLLNNF